MLLYSGSQVAVCGINRQIGTSLLHCFSLSCLQAIKKTVPPQVLQQVLSSKLFVDMWCQHYKGEKAVPSFDVNTWFLHLCSKSCAMRTPLESIDLVSNKRD